MTLHYRYVNAIESRLRWLKWARSESGQRVWRQVGFARAMPVYVDLLERADCETFYMEEHFTSLVEHARQTIPEDMTFDATWLLSGFGFVWLDQPFTVPIVLGRDTRQPSEREYHEDVERYALAMSDQISQFPGAEYHRRVGEVLRSDARFACGLISTMIVQLRARLNGDDTEGFVAHDGMYLVDAGQIAEHFVRLFKSQTGHELDAAKLLDVASKPRNVPEYTEDVRVRAIGWRAIPVGATVYQQDGASYVSTSKMTEILTFQDLQDVGGFGPWSYFSLRDGDALGERIERFEDLCRRVDPKSLYASAVASAQMLRDRRSHPLHEIRWTYAALHLMAQKIAITVRHDTDRVTRRRAQREGHDAPPFVKVVTLRRLHEARKQDGKAHDVDWKWQWIVRGFWRNQWYPSEGVHKPVFVDSFIKGPSDKPLKPETTRLYVARR